jgi:hypothetical protein
MIKGVSFIELLKNQIKMIYLQKLHISENDLNIIKSGKKLSQLTNLTLKDNYIDDNEVKILAQCNFQNLSILNLSGNKIIALGIKHLVSNNCVI